MLDATGDCALLRAFRNIEVPPTVQTITPSWGITMPHEEAQKQWRL
jgi:hypothetical protein